jgi:serine protease AprX
VPAMFEESFSVGATNSADEIAGFSSRGPVTVDGSNRLKPEVSAPGVDVLSSTNGGGYAAYSGTSMAAPHVAGLVALVISANPWLAGRVSDIQQIIKLSARPAYTQDTCGTSYGSNRPNHAYGWGIVNAVEAVNAALALESIEAQDESKGLLIFPNPATYWVEVMLDTDTPENAQVQLFDVQWKLVLQQSFGEKSHLRLNLDQMPNGLYFYQVSNSAQRWSGKISVMR